MGRPAWPVRAATAVLTSRNGACTGRARRVERARTRGRLCWPPSSFPIL